MAALYSLYHRFHRVIYGRCILTDKRNATTKNQSSFIQAVISSNYVEINPQKLLAVSCFESISNCVQWYHQPGFNQGRNLTSRMPCLSSNFQITWIHWKIKRNEVIMGNREVNYPDNCRKKIYPHICLCHAIHVSKLTLTSTITPQGTTLTHEKWFKFLLHISQTYLRW